MARVLCTLRNAGERINHVDFTQDVDGMVSEDISQEQADQFLLIPGYEIIPEDTGENKPAAAKLGANKPAAAKLGANKPAASAIGDGTITDPTE